MLVSKIKEGSPYTPPKQIKSPKIEGEPVIVCNPELMKKANLLSESFYKKEKKKQKTFEFLKNALIMIAFIVIAYLGGFSSNSSDERYEGKVRSGVHR